MKSGEAGFRRSPAAHTVQPVRVHARETGAPNLETTVPSKRAQRRFEESEERRRQRKQRKRERKASEDR
jgi:hypothetical protein